MIKLSTFRVLGCLFGALFYYLFISAADIANIYKLAAFLVCTSLSICIAERLYKACVDKNAS